MAPSDRDRARLAAQAASLEEAETDDEPSPDALSARIAAANAWRATVGIPPLVEDPDDNPPEEELYRRARALGLRRIRR